MPAEYIAGFDIGTTAVKGAIYDLQGKCLCIEREIYHKTQPKNGWVEQDPTLWIESIISIWQGLQTKLDTAVISSLGITSQVNTHVFVDAQHQPLMPAIVWEDQRCASIAQELDNSITADQRKKWWGGQFKVDSSCLLSRAQWLKQHKPELWEKTAWILSPKDFCILQLTGQIATDALTSIGLVSNAGDYLDDVINLVDGLHEKLPPIHAHDEIIGLTTNKRIQENIPTAVGTMDAWACVFGTGATENGKAFQACGTSEIIGLVSDDGAGADGVISFPPLNNIHLHAGPTQSGGDSLNWFAQSQAINSDAVLDLAAQASNENPVIFLPYLMGERAPIWDATAKGVFIGIDKTHTQADFARAVLTGVAYSARHLLESVEAAAGIRAGALYLCGGGANSDLWCQIKADVEQRELHRLENLDSAVFGAALLGAIATSQYPDLASACEYTVRCEKIFQPDPALASFHDEYYEIYRQTYTSLQDVFRQFNKTAQAY